MSRRDDRLLSLRVADRSAEVSREEMRLLLARLSSSAVDCSDEEEDSRRTRSSSGSIVVIDILSRSSPSGDTFPLTGELLLLTSTSRTMGGSASESFCVRTAKTDS